VIADMGMRGLKIPIPESMINMGTLIWLKWVDNPQLPLGGENIMVDTEFAIK
jgi:hypothetical protein